MLFVELRFFVFFAIVFSLYWMLRSNEWRKRLLLAASYTFYGAWDWRFLGLIMLVTAVTYWVGKNAELRPKGDAVRSRALTFGIIFSLCVLGLFKYFNFFSESFSGLANLAGLPVNAVTLQLVLPVGISFYTFQSISYMVDVHRGDIPARRSLLDVSFYIAFFPQLVAGPIVRASDFVPQMVSSRLWSRVDVRACLSLFLVGFIKKACISDNIAPYVDLIFNAPTDFTAASIIAGVLLYGVQIYCDFSGYSDMAIATAGLLGYNFPPNFRAPYLARDIQDFWRRWHMSLSFWLRDYLYIPLGGNRKGETRRNMNLMTTMVLGGLWHGASINFLIWGGLHGTSQIVEKIWNTLVASHIKPFGIAGPIIGGIITYYWVNLAWIFFRAENLQEALVISKAYVLLQSSGVETLPPFVWTVLALLGAVHVIANNLNVFDRLKTIPSRPFALVYGAAFALAISFVPLGYRPFIYFQF